MIQNYPGHQRGLQVRLDQWTPVIPVVLKVLGNLLARLILDFRLVLEVPVIQHFLADRLIPVVLMVLLRQKDQVVRLVQKILVVLRVPVVRQFLQVL